MVQQLTWTPQVDTATKSSRELASDGKRKETRGCGSWEKYTSNQTLVSKDSHMWGGDGIKTSSFIAFGLGHPQVSTPSSFPVVTCFSFHVSHKLANT